MDSSLIIKQLKVLEARFEELNISLQNPDVILNQTIYREHMREHASLADVVSCFREYQKLISEIESSKGLIDTEEDPDILKMAKEDLKALELQRPVVEARLKVMLLPKDPNDDKNIMLEIRAGAGGDEASLFAEQLFRAYGYYADSKGWKTEIYSISDGNVGGFKEVVANISGERVFSRLKYESGVHRVQRVPRTEAAGRVHTSTITVAVLPEAEEVDVEIDTNDLRIDVFRSSGKGGQSVNTTDSAVRLTHIPSGIVISCQDEKSQLKNKNKAMKILYARLLALQVERAQKEASSARLAQIGTGDRSERIRTYNFPQSRITDHRIGLTLHSIDEIMGGALDPLIEPLIVHFQTEALKAQN